MWMPLALEESEKFLHTMACQHEAHHDAHQHIDFLFPFPEKWSHSRVPHWIATGGLRISDRCAGPLPAVVFSFLSRNNAHFDSIPRKEKFTGNISQNFHEPLSCAA